MATRALYLLAINCLFSSATHAADAFLMGAGTSSCGQYLEARSAQNKEVNNIFQSWLHGYLSGVNTTRASSNLTGIKRLPDGASVLAYMDKYCREAPLTDVWQGADKLLIELPRLPPGK